MAKEDRLDNAIMVILTAVISLLMIAYMAIPVITEAVSSLTGGSGEQFGPIILFTLTMMIFATIILIVRGFNGSR
jgi:hypothetical protein